MNNEPRHWLGIRRMDHGVALVYEAPKLRRLFLRLEAPVRVAYVAAIAWIVQLGALSPNQAALLAAVAAAWGFVAGALWGAGAERQGAWEGLQRGFTPALEPARPPELPKGPSGGR